MQSLRALSHAAPLLVLLTPLVTSAQGSVNQPRLDAFDVGTVGAGGELRLRAEDVPQFAEPFSARVVCGPPEAHACLLVGLGELVLPLPEYGGTWYVEQPAPLVGFQFDLEGRSEEFVMESAVSATLLGVPFVAQAFLLDSVSTGGVTLSNPLRVTFGDAALPESRFLYINQNDDGPDGNAVNAYAVAPDGTLAPVAGSPFATGGFGDTSSWDLMAATPDRKHLFALNEGSMDLASFLVQPDGSLVPAPGSPFPTGAIDSTCVEAVNGSVYVNHGNGTIVGFSVQADGALTSLGTWQVDTPNNSELVAGRNGDRLYAFSNNKIWPFDILADGTLLQTGGPSDTSGKVGFGIEVAPDGSHVYVSDRLAFGGELGISVYRVLADGSVEWTGKSFSASLPTVFSSSSNTALDLVLAPDGNTLYAAVHVPIVTSDPGGRVAAIDLTSCCPADVPGSPWVVAGDGYPKSMALSPDGSLLFMATGKNTTAPSQLFGFQVQDDGSLLPLGTGQELFPLGATEDPAGILVL